MNVLSGDETNENHQTEIFYGESINSQNINRRVAIHKTNNF